MTLRGKSIEGANDQGFFCEDDRCPSQPISKEEKPNLFDELGGIPAPKSDDWDKEEDDEPSNKRRQSIFANMWLPW